MDWKYWWTKIQFKARQAMVMANNHIPGIYDWFDYNI